MTSLEMARKLTTLFDDVLEKRVTPEVANAAANVAGRMLKLTELQRKFAGTSRQNIFPDENGRINGELPPAPHAS
jgi:hypothetical protein